MTAGTWAFDVEAGIKEKHEGIPGGAVEYKLLYQTNSPPHDAISPNQKTSVVRPMA